MLANIREDGIDPSAIKSIVVTHAHGDHACGAKFFKEKLGAQIIASDIDARLMEEGTDEELGLNIARGPIYPSDYKYIHTKVDKRVAEGEELRWEQGPAVHNRPWPHAGGDVRALEERGDHLHRGRRLLQRDHRPRELARIGPRVDRGNIDKLSGLGVKQLFPGHFAFTLKDGQVHLDKAVANLKLPFVPPVWGHNHPAR